MGAIEASGLLLDTQTTLQAFVTAFASIYLILIFATVLMGWIRIPYSRTTAAVQEFLDEVVRPYLRLFRFLPTVGPFDLSPIVGCVVLLVAAGLVNSLIGLLL
jgi:YggT family protein